MRVSNRPCTDAAVALSSATRAGPWERYKGLMELMGGVIAFAVVVYGALYVIVLLAGVWWDTFVVCSCLRASLRW